MVGLVTNKGKLSASAGVAPRWGINTLPAGYGGGSRGPVTGTGPRVNRLRQEERCLPGRGVSGLPLWQFFVFPVIRSICAPLSKPQQSFIFQQRPSLL